MYRLISKYRGQIMGVAAIMVVLLHYFTELYPDFHIPVVSLVLARGNVGVDIFLLVSGMGLWFSMSKGGTILQFWKKRIQRVMIPCLAISLPYWIWNDFFYKKLSLGEFVLDWTGLSFWLMGTTTIWYVAFILVMYLIYPLVFQIQRKKTVYAVLLLLGCIGLSGILFFVFPDYYAAIEIAITRIPIFLVGSLLGEYLQCKEQENITLKWILNFYFILSLMAAVCSFLFYSQNHTISVMLYRYGSGGLAILICFMVGWIFERCKLAPVADICGKVGAISLELYLIHVFIRNILAATKFGALSGFAIQLLIIVCFAALSVLVTFGVVRIKTMIEQKLKR